MTTTQQDPPVVRREAAARGVLIVLAVGATYLLALVIVPFWKALFLGAVLAAALSPGYERLAARFRGRRQLASAVVTLAVVLVLVVPTFLLTFTIAREAVNGARYVRETLRSEGVAGLVQDLPPRMRGLAQRLVDQIPKDEEQQISGAQGSQAAAAVGTVLTATSSALIQAGMMLIAFFFLLIDGPRLVDWICANAPLPASHTRGLFQEFRKVTVAVIVSSATTAAVQALVALVGYWIARVPHPLFFAAVTFLFAFVPAVGGGGTSVALAALVFVTGHPGAALFLVIWGTLVVGLSDNALKPLLMQSDVHLHGALIFFALVGGLTCFGGIGLVAGPLILVFFIAVVKMCRNEYKPAPAE